MANWIYKELNTFRKYSVTCSNCGAEYIGDYDQYTDPEDFNYCPSCGSEIEEIYEEEVRNARNRKK